jgi:hypothetical protein
VRWVAGLVVLGLLGAIIISLALGASSGSNAIAPPTGPTTTAPACTTDASFDPGGGQTTSPTYQVDPPAGGDYAATSAPAGNYTTDPPTDAELVHSLARGYVIIWFDPSTEVADLSGIEQVAASYPKDTLIVPRIGMQSPLVATAWHQRLLCQKLDATVLSDFIAASRNQGPETVAH